MCFILSHKGIISHGNNLPWGQSPMCQTPRANKGLKGARLSQKWPISHEAKLQTWDQIPIGPKSYGAKVPGDNLPWKQSPMGTISYVPNSHGAKVPWAQSSKFPLGQIPIGKKSSGPQRPMVIVPKSNGPKATFSRIPMVPKPNGLKAPWSQNPRVLKPMVPKTHGPKGALGGQRGP